MSKVVLYVLHPQWVQTSEGKQRYISNEILRNDNGIAKESNWITAEDFLPAHLELSDEVKHIYPQVQS